MTYVADLLAARPHLTMHALDGLVMDDVKLAAIAQQVGTPTWVMSAGAIRSRYAALAAAFAGQDVHIHYAVKANDHLAVLRLLGRLGAGADVVSEGELRRAEAAGIAASRIVFSGVGKSLPALRAAIASDIAQINVESAEELEMLAGMAQAMDRPVRVSLRINPDVDPGTHAKITTGRAGNKFGIACSDALALYRRAAALPNVNPVGLAVHIGSQIMTMAPYVAAFTRVAELIHALREAGFAPARVDCGGGLGIPYRNEPASTPAALAGAIRTTLGGLGVRLMIEPGRWLVGPAGVLLTSVILVKHAAARRFVVLDAAMNDLVRPAMYDAWHEIVPLSPIDAQGALSPADVVGPVCETGDTFATDRMLPALAPNANMAILDAGAYGAVMSSTYNARPLAAQVLVDGAFWSVIRPRQTIESLWETELVPEFLRA